MTGIDWELRAYEAELYRLRYTTRAPRDASDILKMNSEVRTGDPASPHRVKNFPIKSSCKIAYSCDQTWDRHPNGRVLLREEPIDWLADRGFRHCVSNSFRDIQDTKVWKYGWIDAASPPCGVFYFGEPDIALMFKLTWG